MPTFDLRLIMAADAALVGGVEAVEWMEPTISGHPKKAVKLSHQLSDI